MLAFLHREPRAIVEPCSRRTTANGYGHSRNNQAVLLWIHKIQLHRMANATCPVDRHHISHGDGPVVQLVSRRSLRFGVAGPLRGTSAGRVREKLVRADRRSRLIANLACVDGASPRRRSSRLSCCGVGVGVFRAVRMTIKSALAPGNRITADQLEYCRLTVFSILNV